MSQSKTAVNKTQWGTITILTGDNFTVFETQAKKALATAGCWKLIDGTDEGPGVKPDGTDVPKYKDWKQKFEIFERKRENAVKILSTSIDDSLVDDDIESSLIDGNPQAMWNALAKFNQMNNRVWISAKRKDFNNEKFDYKNETIQSFYTRLLNHKAELSSTTRPISTEDVLEKLLDAIPEDDFSWAQARLDCLNSSFGLSETMTILNNVTKPGGSSGSANFASSKDTGRSFRGNRGNRGQQGRSGQNSGHGQPYNLNNVQRGGRNRGNGRARGRGYRGNNYNPHHHASFGGKSNSRVDESHVKLFCKFCQDDGHDETSCHRYKRFANEAREEV